MEDIHKISSLTKDTHRDTCLLMETTTRWVLQNPKQLREDTLAHSGYPYESHGIKFPQLPLLGTSSDAFSLLLSHHRSSPPPALSRHRRLPPIRRRCSPLSPSLTRRGSLPHPLPFATSLSPPPVAAADEERRAGCGGRHCPPRLVLASPRSHCRPRFRHRRRSEAADLAPSCADLAPSRLDRMERRRPRRIEEEAAAPAEEVAQVVVGIVSRSLSSPSHRRLSPLTLSLAATAAGLSLSLSLPSPASVRAMSERGKGWKVKFFGGNSVHKPRSRPTRIPCQKRARAASPAEAHVPSQEDGVDKKANGHRWSVLGIISRGTH